MISQGPLNQLMIYDNVLDDGETKPDTSARAGEETKGIAPNARNLLRAWDGLEPTLRSVVVVRS
jgi:hypothetical protein